MRWVNSIDVMRQTNKMTEFEGYGLNFLILYFRFFSLHFKAVPLPSNAHYVNFQGGSFEHDVDFA